jgi:hypothetical protein
MTNICRHIAVERSAMVDVSWVAMFVEKSSDVRCTKKHQQKNKNTRAHTYTKCYLFNDYWGTRSTIH